MSERTSPSVQETRPSSPPLGEAFVDETPHPAETFPTPETEIDDFRIGKIVIAGLDRNIRTRSIDAARARLNRELAEGGKLKRLGKAIWRGNWAREVYLKRYELQARAEIIANDNIYHHETVSDDYIDATLERMASEHDEVIHTAAGESRVSIKAETLDSKEKEVRQRVIDFVKQDALGEFSPPKGTPEAFDENRKKLIADLLREGLLDGNNIDSVHLSISNLKPVGEQIRARLSVEGLAVEDDAAKTLVDEMLADTEIIIGEAKVGARGEAELSRTDRILEKLNGKRPPWLNETTIAVGAATVVALFAWARGRAIGIAGRFTPGLAAATLVAGTEYTRMRQDQAQHNREMAEGKFEGVELKGRRAKLERGRAAAPETAEGATMEGCKAWITEEFYKDGKLEIASPAMFEELLQRMANVRARIDVGIETEENLMVASKGKFDVQNAALSLALAKLTTDLRHYIDGIDPDDLATFGYTPEMIASIQGGEDALDVRIQGAVDSQHEIILRYVAETRAEADRIHLIEVSKKATVAGGLGFLFGVSVAEGVSLMSDVMSDTPQAATEAAGTGDIKLVSQESTQHLANADADTIKVSDSTKINVPDGFKVDASEKTHTFTVTAPDGTKIEGLKLTTAGTITDEAATRLQEAGISVGISDGGVEVDYVQKQVKISTAEYAQQHQADMTSIEHEGWMDHDTSGIFEGDEQKLDNGLRKPNGDIRLNIGRMEGTSFHNGKHVNWEEEAANGNMQVTVYATKGTYNQGFTFQVDKQGHAIIPKGHPAQELFSNGQGRLDFQGYLVEAQFVDETKSNGTQKVWTLATDVGEKHSTVTYTKEVPVLRDTTTYTLGQEKTPAAQTPETDNDVPRIFPIPPVMFRRGLTPPSRAGTGSATIPPRPGSAPLGTLPSSGRGGTGGITGPTPPPAGPRAGRPSPDQQSSPRFTTTTPEDLRDESTASARTVLGALGVGPQDERDRQEEEARIAAERIAADQQRAEEQAREAAARTAGEEAARQAEEERLRTEAEARAEQERKQQRRAAAEAERQRIAEEKEAARLKKLPKGKEYFDSFFNTRADNFYRVRFNIDATSSPSFSQEALNGALNAINSVLGQDAELAQQVAAGDAAARRRLYKRASRLLHTDTINGPNDERAFTDDQKQMFQKAFDFLEAGLSSPRNKSERNTVKTYEDAIKTLKTELNDTNNPPTPERRAAIVKNISGLYEEIDRLTKKSKSQGATP